VPPSGNRPSALYYHPPALEKLKIQQSSGMNNSLLLLNSSGKCYSQDLVSGDKIPQKFKNSILNPDLD
jgi:hypothetical protein